MLRRKFTPEKVSSHISFITIFYIHIIFQWLIKILYVRVSRNLKFCCIDSRVWFYNDPAISS